MARMTPQEVADKWATRLGAATADIKAGVDRVTEAPGRKAAAQSDAWLANLTAKRDKWASRVAAVSTEDWKAATKLGADRVATGAQQKKGKMANFMAEFLPFQEGVTQRVRSMPRGNLEQNIARMVEQARQTAQFKRRG